MPWVLAGVGRAWAWDPHLGLLRLPDLNPGGSFGFEYDALSPDGRLLTAMFELERRPAEGSPAERRLARRAIFDFASGETVVATVPQTPVFLGPNGLRLEVSRELRADGTWLFDYVLNREGRAAQLDVPDHLGVGFGGPGAQFSPSGSLVAISHSLPSAPGRWVNVVDVTSGSVRRIDDVAIHSYGAWSPSGERLLVRGLYGFPRVAELSTGAIRDLAPALGPDPAAATNIGGWITDTEIANFVPAGRRLILRVVDVDTGARHDILDFPRPVSQRDFSGIRFAPYAAQADPSRIGYLGN